MLERDAFLAGNRPLLLDRTERALEGDREARLDLATVATVNVRVGRVRSVAQHSGRRLVAAGFLLAPAGRRVA